MIILIKNKGNNSGIDTNLKLEQEYAMLRVSDLCKYSDNSEYVSALLDLLNKL